MAEMWSIEMSMDVESMGSVAARLEADGWDGMHVTDSQNRSPESYIALTVAAGATSRLGLGIGVTNPVTRHPALAAACAASVQRVSGGRMTLSIGRGDSALAHIGLSPVSVDEFQRYVSILRRYLRGEPVTLAEASRYGATPARPVDDLELAAVPEGSRLEWRRPSDAPVPLEIVGTGPKILAFNAVAADRPLIAVGAAPERVEWAVEQIRSARRAAGLDPDVPIGAFVSMCAHDDADTAKRLIRGTLATTSRFSVMHGKVSGPADAASAEVLADIRRLYDMKAHGTAGSSQSSALTDEFVTTYGVAGTGPHCAERLTQLAALGIDKFIVFPLGRNVDPAEVEQVRKVTAAHVLPAVRDLTPTR